MASATPGEVNQQLNEGVDYPGRESLYGGTVEDESACTGGEWMNAGREVIGDVVLMGTRNVFAVSRRDPGSFRNAFGKDQCGIMFDARGLRYLWGVLAAERKESGCGGGESALAVKEGVLRLLLSLSRSFENGEVSFGLSGENDMSDMFRESPGFDILGESGVFIVKRVEKDYSCIVPPSIDTAARSTDVLGGRTKGHFVPVLLSDGVGSSDGDSSTELGESIIAAINEHCGTFRVLLRDGDRDESGGPALNKLGARIKSLEEKRYQVEETRVADDGVRYCEELHHVPSRAEFFSEYVLRSKPVILRGVAVQSPALRKWDLEFFRELYKNKKIHVKVNPVDDFEGFEKMKDWLLPLDGDMNNSEEVRETLKKFVPQYVLDRVEDPSVLLVRPVGVDMEFTDFLDSLNGTSEFFSGKNVSAYIEYSAMSHTSELLQDVEEMPFLRKLMPKGSKEGEHKAQNGQAELDWAKKVGKMQLELSSHNLWFGNGKTYARNHFDHYENTLIQIKGSKRVFMFDPYDNRNFYEGFYLEAKYKYDKTRRDFVKSIEGDEGLHVATTFSPVDVMSPDTARYPLFIKAAKRGLQCEIFPGDALYMPSSWWHSVQSTQDPILKVNVAHNYWYTPLYSKKFPCKECSPHLNKAYHHML
eukprot:Nk52_evm12s1705 gene=Nk52_evmTU12s1705